MGITKQVMDDMVYNHMKGIAPTRKSKLSKGELYGAGLLPGLAAEGCRDYFTLIIYALCVNNDSIIDANLAIEVLPSIAVYVGTTAVGNLISYGVTRNEKDGGFI